jgi:hypothetical protein
VQVLAVRALSLGRVEKRLPETKPEDTSKQTEAEGKASSELNWTHSSHARGRECVNVRVVRVYRPRTRVSMYGGSLSPSRCVV